MFPQSKRFKKIKARHLKFVNTVFKIGLYFLIYIQTLLLLKENGIISKSMTIIEK